MADLSVSVTVQATVGGKSFTWTRTGTIADIEAASVVASDRTGGSAAPNVLFTDNTFTKTSDSPHTYTGPAFVAVAGSGAYGAVSVDVDDPTSAVTSLTSILPHGLPLFLYTGYDFNGAINKDTVATVTPTYDIGNVSVTAISGLNKFQALAGYKPIS